MDTDRNLLFGVPLLLPDRRTYIANLAGLSMASKTVTNCKPDPSRLGMLAECRKRSGSPDHRGEWPGQFLSTRTIAYSCGVLARQGEGVVHAHEAEELTRCRRLAAEGDHTLGRFWIPANVGEPVPKKITEAVLRKAMRDTVYPGALLTIEPFKKTSDWWKRVDEVAQRRPGVGGVRRRPSGAVLPDDLQAVVLEDRRLAWVGTGYAA
jgi:hypothetical protein